MRAQHRLARAIYSIAVASKLVAIAAIILHYTHAGMAILPR